MTRTPLALAALLLAGCTVGPDFKAPEAKAPAAWHALSEAGGMPSRAVTRAVNQRWWESFNDPELTRLEAEAAKQNLDLAAAIERVAESRAQAGIVGADALPTLNGNASYTRELASKRGILTLGSQSGSNGTSANGTGSGAGGIPASTFQPFDLWQYGFDATWELDLWGRVRREQESAAASVEASADAAQGALISVLAEVARDYIQLRGVQTNLAIARENLGIASQSLRLTQERTAAGLTSQLDVANASAQVASVEAQIPALEQQEQQLFNALALLLAREPGALAGELGIAKPVPPTPPEVPIGLPSELARRRPDIRQAEAQLHSATADIGVAVADYFPRITLSGSVGLQALQFKDLGSWNAGQYAFGPSITLPIFEGGRIAATVELRKAQQREAAIAYRKTVLSAFHDVDNALIAYQAEQRRRARLETQVVQNRRALGLAQDQYKQGLVDFLTVLDAQRTLLAAQQELANSTTTISTDAVALYKALGGGWEAPNAA